MESGSERLPLPHGAAATGDETTTQRFASSRSPSPNNPTRSAHSTARSPCGRTAISGYRAAHGDQSKSLDWFGWPAMLRMAISLSHMSHRATLQTPADRRRRAFSRGQELMASLKCRVHRLSRCGASSARIHTTLGATIPSVFGLTSVWTFDFYPQAGRSGRTPPRDRRQSLLNRESHIQIGVLR
jgi:hypothetical protein